MTSEPTLRLFVAAELPADQLAWLERETRPLKELWSGARWTTPANQHVTLKFLGSTPARMLGDVAAACGTVASEIPPSDIGLGRLGAFPNPRRARVLWVGLDGSAATLASLAARLDARLEALGFARERRAFSAHVTLARLKVPQPLRPFPALGPPPPPFRLGEFALWRSRLSPKGAHYEVLERFPLGAADGA